MNIYVGNFSNDVTAEDLKEVFEAFGQVSEVKLIKDKYSGESRGFAFVEMPLKKEAEEAMNGIREIKGRMVAVNEARPREDNRSRSRRDSRDSRDSRGNRGRSSHSGRY